jgi:hypothetical protein
MKSKAPDETICFTSKGQYGILEKRYKDGIYPKITRKQRYLEKFKHNQSRGVVIRRFHEPQHCKLTQMQQICAVAPDHHDPSMRAGATAKSWAACDGSFPSLTTRCQSLPA